MTGEMAVIEQSNALPARYELTVDQVIAQAHKVQEVASKAMKEGEHYGVIPGTAKPTLLQPGAQKLLLTFRLDPQYASAPIAPDTGGGGHLTIKSVCTLYHIPTGERMGSGEGSCSTREEKYAYRRASRLCPACGSAAIIKGREEYGGGWVCFAKKGGCGAKYKDGDAAIETQPAGRVANESLADSYNTVLKMANKRALVAAILNVTAASDVFTQDLEDVVPESAVPAVTARSDRTPPADVVEIEAPEDAAPPDDRGILLGRINGVFDKRRLNAGDRAKWWDKHCQGLDPRTADVSVLADLYAALKAKYGD